MNNACRLAPKEEMSNVSMEMCRLQNSEVKVSLLGGLGEQALDQWFSTTNLWLRLLWGPKDSLTGATYETSCISDIYIMIHNSSKIAVMK